MHARSQVDFLARRLPAKTGGESQERLFAFQCQSLKLPEFEEQYYFVQSQHAENRHRRWIADFAFVRQLVMVEIDGGIFRHGGGAHSHPTDIVRNMRKQNDASLLGFLTLRFTPQEVISGHAVAFTQRVLHAKGWRPAV